MNISKISKSAVPVIALVGALLFAGCTPQASTSTSAPAPAGDAPASSAPAQAAQPAADAKYAVTIDGSRITQDYQGANAIIVSFTFTNNSDKDASFMFATNAQAFQNGVQLESAIVTDSDASAALKELKPGASVAVERAYLLTDNTDVSVEVSELMSFDDSTIAEKTFSVQ